jgi:flagellar biosynthesis/type III secretory pathway protein FliH
MRPLFVLLFILVWDVAMFLVFRAWGYRRGHKEGAEDGYQRGYDAGHIAGRRDADNWWIEVEAEADQARQKIWKEEMES